MLQLEAALDRQEHQLFPLLWGPRDDQWRVQGGDASGCPAVDSVCHGITW